MIILTDQEAKHFETMLLSLIRQQFWALEIKIPVVRKKRTLCDDVCCMVEILLTGGMDIMVRT